jgi:hypothetical protein
MTPPSRFGGIDVLEFSVPPEGIVPRTANAA